MSSTTTPTTFLDLFYDLLQRVKVQLGTTAADATNLAYAKKFINQALHDVHIQQNWPWAERRAMLITNSPYTTGKANIAAATRTTLEGTGSTLWNTAVTGMGFNNMRTGGKVTFSGESDVYLISGVTNNTTATLDSRFVGSVTTASAYALADASYRYFEDEYALASDFWRLVDTREFSSALPIPVLARQEFYRRFVRNSSPSTPRICTLIELGPSTSVSPQPRLIFHPPPSTVLTIPYRYITTNLAVSAAGVAATNLSADTDEPIIPLRYRHVLVAYALADWYRDLKDDARAQEARAAYVDLIQRMANDSEPTRDHPRLAPRRRQYLATSAGTALRGGRFSTGTEFDELRDRN